MTEETPTPTWGWADVSGAPIAATALCMQHLFFIEEVRTPDAVSRTSTTPHPCTRCG